MRAHILANASDLFRHVSAEKAAFYRAIMDVFAAAKRQYRLQLRPDEVLAEARWPGEPPRIEEVNAALAQLADWGNLASHPDTARVSSLSDFYRARFLYRLSQGGEAVESALAFFVQTLQRRAELQTVALEDIASRLQALQALARRAAARRAPRSTRRCATWCVCSKAWPRTRRPSWPASRAASSCSRPRRARSSSYKRRLIDYLERFMGDLVRRSDAIARHILALAPRIDALLRQVAEREARDAAPGDAQDAGRGADALPGKPGGSAGGACAAGSSAPATSRRKPNCCGRGRARPSRNCWAPSPRSTSGAAAAATARPISACSPAGSPPAPTTPRRTGWRAPPLRSIRRGISRSTPTRTPICRPARAGPMRRRCRFTRACANTAKPRRADRCRACATAAEARALLALQLAEEVAAGGSRAPAPRHRPADAPVRAGRTRPACLRPVPGPARRSADANRPGRKRRSSGRPATACCTSAWSRSAPTATPRSPRRTASSPAAII